MRIFYWRSIKLGYQVLRCPPTSSTTTLLRAGGIREESGQDRKLLEEALRNVRVPRQILLRVAVQARSSVAISILGVDSPYQPNFFSIVTD
jgi:hypothetical protein